MTTHSDPLTDAELDEVRAYANGEVPASPEAVSQGRMIANRMLAQLRAERAAFQEMALGLTNQCRENQTEIDQLRAELESVKDVRASESDEYTRQLRALPGWCRACPPGCNSCLGPDCECYEHDELTVEGQNAMIWDLQTKLSSVQDGAARLRGALAEAPSRRDLLIAEEIMRAAQLGQHKAETERDALAAKLDAVQEIQPQRRNSAMVTSEQLAMMRGWNDAVDEIRAKLELCTCSLTDPSTWETYGDNVEPGSLYEWNPDCPAHGDAPAAPESPRPPAVEPVERPATPDGGTDTQTPVSEPHGSIQASEEWQVRITADNAAGFVIPADAESAHRTAAEWRASLASADVGYCVDVERRFVGAWDPITEGGQADER